MNVFDKQSGALVQCTKEIAPSGLRVRMIAQTGWIERILTGAEIDAAYGAFEARDHIALGEIMFPTQQRKDELQWKRQTSLLTA